MSRPVNRTDKREFKFESARATVFVSTDRTVAVSRVLSSKPGQGHGTILMQQICEWADKNGLILWLEVQRFHYSKSRAPSNEQLVAFYRKFDFEIVDDGRSPIMMDRKFAASR